MPHTHTTSHSVCRFRLQEWSSSKTSSPWTVTLSWRENYISKMTYKYSKLGQTDLVTGMWSEFIGRSVRAGLQVSKCSGYHLCHTQTSYTISSARKGYIMCAKFHKYGVCQTAIFLRSRGTNHACKVAPFPFFICSPKVAQNKQDGAYSGSMTIIFLDHYNVTCRRQEWRQVCGR